MRMTVRARQLYRARYIGLAIGQQCRDCRKKEDSRSLILPARITSRLNIIGDDGIKIETSIDSLQSPLTEIRNSLLDGASTFQRYPSKHLQVH